MAMKIVYLLQERKNLKIMFLDVLSYKKKKEKLFKLIEETFAKMENSINTNFQMRNAPKSKMF